MEITLSAVVSVVGAGVSVTTLVFTVYWAHQEIDRWRKTQAAAKRAEVAGEVLVETLRFLVHLEGRLNPEIPNAEYELQRVRVFAEASDRFVSAWQLVHAYLPEQAHDVLNKIWKQRDSIIAAQSRCAMEAAEGQQVPQSVYDQAYGRPIHDKIVELRAEAMKVLRPIAALGNDKL